jgi:hypothetical protein
MSSSIQNFYKETITRNWTATTGDFNVSVKPTISSGYLVISPNNPTLREIVKYSATGTNLYGDFVTISNISDRGLGGTTAQNHTISEPIRMNITAEHWNEVSQVESGIVAPSSTPTKIGDIYVDTVAHKFYISDGTTSSANWVIIN